MFISHLKRYLLVLAFGGVSACTGGVIGPANTPAPFDPVTMDLPSIDPENPPATIELNFESAGKRLNGHLYLANGAGPHPTLILLHGLPGNERNLDLAQSVRRAGFNVLYFHYRGAWGSAGDYSFTHVIEDALAAADFLRSDKPVSDYRIDPTRIIYLGHSMGGFAALAAGARDKNAICTGAMSPADLSVLAAAFENKAARQGFAAYMDSIGEAEGGPKSGEGFGPLRGITGASAVADIIALGNSFSMPSLAPEFTGRSVLLTAAKGDTVLPPETFFDPLVAAYSVEPDLNLTQMIFESDHSYSWERIALAQTVVDWLNADCR